jgi:drug/metabolite transporter (DMT)-like permease
VILLQKQNPMSPLRIFGLTSLAMLAFGGMVGLLLPGLVAPPLLGSILMLGAGVAWGFYSLRGKGAGDPTSVVSVFGAEFTWVYAHEYGSRTAQSSQKSALIVPSHTGGGK